MLDSKENHLPFVVLMLGAIFSAWASYRMHVLAQEVMVHDIIRELIQMQGRAPDQFRTLPYLLIGILDKALSLLPYLENSLRYAILMFDALFILLSVWLLRVRFVSQFSVHYVWIFFLIYPILMFGGYRPVSSFVLFLAVLWVSVVCMRKAREWHSKEILGMLALLIVVCFTRADVALLLALCLIPRKELHGLVKCLAVVLPLAIQCMLKFVLFPDAQYYTKVVMLADNAGLSFLLSSPLTYLLLAWAVFYREAIKQFVVIIWRFDRVILLVLLGYIFTLFIIARPDEYRLFLPLLPIILWMKTQHKPAWLASFSK